MSTRIADYTTYQRRTRTKDGEVNRCLFCGKFGLNVGGEWIHKLHVEDGLWVTYKGDSCAPVMAVSV